MKRINLGVNFCVFMIQTVSFIPPPTNELIKQLDQKDGLSMYWPLSNLIHLTERTLSTSYQMHLSINIHYNGFYWPLQCSSLELTMLRVLTVLCALRLHATVAIL